MKKIKKRIKIGFYIAANITLIFFNALLSAQVNNSNMVYAINTGGSAVTVAGIDYVSDQAYLIPSDSSKVYSVDKTVFDYSGSSFSGLDDSAADSLFNTERFGSDFGYEFNGLSQGYYKITLYFAEIYHTESDKRIFKVLLQDNQYFDSVDIMAELGNGSGKILTKEIYYNLIGDNLKLRFRAVKDKAKVSALTIEASGPPPNSAEYLHAINVGGGAFYSIHDKIHYIADDDLPENKGSLSYVHPNGRTYADFSQNIIDASGDDYLYQTERFGSLQYKLNVGEPGVDATYDVILKYAEIYPEAADKRKFKAVFEGNTTAAEIIDVNGEDNDLASYTARSKSFEVMVNDGILNIDIQSIDGGDKPKLSALLVRRQQRRLNESTNLPSDLNQARAIASFNDDVKKFRIRSPQNSIILSDNGYVLSARVKIHDFAGNDLRILFSGFGRDFFSLRSDGAGGFKIGGNDRNSGAANWDGPGTYCLPSADFKQAGIDIFDGGFHTYTARAWSLEDAKQTEYYIDGLLVCTIDAIYSNNLETIGGGFWSDSSTLVFGPEIDDAVVYDSYIYSSELEFIFNRNYTGFRQEPAALWNFEYNPDATGDLSVYCNQLQDKSGKGRHLECNHSNPVTITPTVVVGDTGETINNTTPDNRRKSVVRSETDTDGECGSIAEQFPGYTIIDKLSIVPRNDEVVVNQYEDTGTIVSSPATTNDLSDKLEYYEALMSSTGSHIAAFKYEKDDFNLNENLGLFIYEKGSDGCYKDNIVKQYNGQKGTLTHLRMTVDSVFTGKDISFRVTNPDISLDEIVDSTPYYFNEKITAHYGYLDVDGRLQIRNPDSYCVDKKSIGNVLTTSEENKQRNNPYLLKRHQALVSKNDQYLACLDQDLNFSIFHRPNPQTPIKSFDTGIDSEGWLAFRANNQYVILNQYTVNTARVEVFNYKFFEDYSAGFEVLMDYPGNVTEAGHNPSTRDPYAVYQELISEGHTLNFSDNTLVKLSLEDSGDLILSTEDPTSHFLDGTVLWSSNPDWVFSQPKEQLPSSITASAVTTYSKRNFLTTSKLVTYNELTVYGSECDRIESELGVGKSGVRECVHVQEDKGHKRLTDANFVSSDSSIAHNVPMSIFIPDGKRAVICLRPKLAGDIDQVAPEPRQCSTFLESTGDITPRFAPLFKVQASEITSVNYDLIRVRIFELDANEEDTPPVDETNDDQSNNDDSRKLISAQEYARICTIDRVWNKFDVNNCLEAVNFIRTIQIFTGNLDKFPDNLEIYFNDEALQAKWQTLTCRQKVETIFTGTSPVYPNDNSKKYIGLLCGANDLNGVMTYSDADFSPNGQLGFYENAGLYGSACDNVLAELGLSGGNECYQESDFTLQEAEFIPELEMVQIEPGEDTLEMPKIPRSIQVPDGYSVTVCIRPRYPVNDDIPRERFCVGFGTSISDTQQAFIDQMEDTGTIRIIDDVGYELVAIEVNQYDSADAVSQQNEERVRKIGFLLGRLCSPPDEYLAQFTEQERDDLINGADTQIIFNQKYNSYLFDPENWSKWTHCPINSIWAQYINVNTIETAQGSVAADREHYIKYDCNSPLSDRNPDCDNDHPVLIGPDTDSPFGSIKDEALNDHVLGNQISNTTCLILKEDEGSESFIEENCFKESESVEKWQFNTKSFIRVTDEPHPINLTPSANIVKITKSVGKTNHFHKCPFVDWGEHCIRAGNYYVETRECEEEVKNIDPDAKCSRYHSVYSNRENSSRSVIVTKSGAESKMAALANGRDDEKFETNRYVIVTAEELAKGESYFGVTYQRFPLEGGDNPFSPERRYYYNLCTPIINEEVVDAANFEVVARDTTTENNLDEEDIFQKYFKMSCQMDSSGLAIAFQDYDHRWSTYYEELGWQIAQTIALIVIGDGLVKLAELETALVERGLSRIPKKFIENYRKYNINVINNILGEGSESAEYWVSALEKSSLYNYPTTFFGRIGLLTYSATAGYLGLRNIANCEDSTCAAELTGSMLRLGLVFSAYGIRLGFEFRRTGILTRIFKGAGLSAEEAAEEAEIELSELSESEAVESTPSEMGESEESSGGTSDGSVNEDENPQDAGSSGDRSLTTSNYIPKTVSVPRSIEADPENIAIEAAKGGDSARRAQELADERGLRVKQITKTLPYLKFFHEGAIESVRHQLENR